MEDEDGTCLLDVLCDPQALNDFLHGTNELQTEDLLISSSSGEPSLFTDAPSPISLLGDGRDSPDTPPPGCVDLSFLEEVLLSSPEGGEDPQVEQGGTPAEAFVAKKGEVEEAEEAEVACDILQQSLQEAEITEQTMALEAGLAQPGDSLSLYSPAPLLSPPAVPFIPKSVTLPITQALPRDTQAAVEPPQPSLLAVGPGCPSLKPAAPPQLMGLLPGNVFAAASPETSFSLSPAQASSMIIHKAVPSVTGRPLITPTLRAAAAAGLVLQRAPFPIQPKMPISIQPRLVQISPKPSGQKHTPGLTFLPGTASPNILLSQTPGQKPAAPPPQASQQLPKPVSLQLVNQGGSFVLQPQGLFQGQNQFLLPGQSPVTISQSASAARPLLTPSHHGASLHNVNPSAGHLVEGSQILTVPQRQLNFSPIFTTSSGQLALRQATVLSGPLQLQSAPPTVFQMPAQLAGTYTPGGQGQRTTLVHGPALGNHITLINSSGVLPPDLTSISIVNGPSVVRGLPFAARAPVPQTGEGQLSLQQASVVLLPERPIQEERTGSEETFHQLSQPYGHVLHHLSVQPTPAGLQSSSPPAVTVLQPPPEPPEPPLDPEPAVEIPKLLMAPSVMTQVVEEVTHSMSQNEAFMQHLQQQALSSPITSELLVGSLPAAPMESLASPVANEREAQAASGQDARTAMSDQCVEASPLHSDPADAPLICSPSPIQDTERPAPPSFSTQIPAPGPEGSVTAPQSRIEPQVQYQVPHQLQASQALFAQNPVQIEPAVSQTRTQVQVQPSVSQPQSSVSASVHSPPPLRVSVPHQQPDPTAASARLSEGGGESAVQQHTQIKPTAALVVESKAFTLDVHPPSPAAPGVQAHRPPPAPIQTTGTKLADPAEQPRDERLTPATRRHRFQQQICSDRAAVQTPFAGPAFPTLKDAVKRLLPYHSCAGHLPTQEDFNLVDQEFDTVSGFLLKRTKDMVNKYRQLLVREAQQESPSAEMVMLERLFLQAERCALAEDRRRVRRDPESFMTALATSASSPHGAPSSGSPSSPPAWTRLSDRPPGLKTYRSSSRGALRLTIKQESGSRKVVHNSACDPGLKRDHTGQLTNGGGAVKERHPQAPNGAPRRPEHDEEGGSNGAVLCDAVKDVPQAAPHPKIKAPNPLSMPEPQVGCFELPPRDVSGPKLKCYRLDESPRPEPRFSPPPPPLQEDNMLTEHLQSAIDSILELQRLQGPSAAPTRATSGPSLDHAVTSILEGHL
ncbi:BRD4-interacting chromatin-remodeling complex-associated protein [Cyclopterus lumpus]|uniref:BRD4-interacting chromatin-remodeling complex-associated protein n=1 Tax=Cyclopterus lumpus TaxID=8103 RepID=UPI0014869C64|nr:BRD4-interacting chromatin-remodeling complex-associated protein [Cyclopterus lumpus]